VGDIAALALYLSLAAMLVKLARFELVNQSQETGLMVMAGLFVLCSYFVRTLFVLCSYFVRTLFVVARREAYLRHLEILSCCF
jgi:hypothetical protein